MLLKSSLKKSGQFDILLVDYHKSTFFVKYFGTLHNVSLTMFREHLKNSIIIIIIILLFIEQAATTNQKMSLCQMHAYNNNNTITYVTGIIL